MYTYDMSKLEASAFHRGFLKAEKRLSRTWDYIFNLITTLDREIRERYLHAIENQHVFTLFPLLPVEIRILIWKAAFDQYPHQACRYILEPLEQANVVKMSLPIGRLDSLCPMLLTCAEARGVAEQEFDGCVRACEQRLPYYRAVARSSRSGQWAVECYFDESFKTQRDVISPKQCSVCGGRCGSCRKFYFTKSQDFHISALQLRWSDHPYREVRQTVQELQWAANIRHLSLFIESYYYTYYSSNVGFTAEEFKNYIKTFKNLETLTFIAYGSNSTTMVDLGEEKTKTVESKDLQIEDVAKFLASQSSTPWPSPESWWQQIPGVTMKILDARGDPRFKEDYFGALNAYFAKESDRLSYSRIRACLANVN